MPIINANPADVFDRIILWNTERGLDKNEYNVDVATKMILEEVLEGNGLGDNKILLDSLCNTIKALKQPIDSHEATDWLDDIIVLASGEVIKQGRHPRKTMEQTLLEIESRTGDLNTTTGKWEKFKTPEAIAKWVTADYEGCEYE